MYTEEVVSIAKADDGGYIIHVRVKRKKNKESKGEIMSDHGMDKTLLAKDLDDVNKVLAEVLPNIKSGGMEEDEFAKAFKEAVKEDD